MRKIYAKSIADFMNEGFIVETVPEKIAEHIKRHQSFYIHAGSFTVMFLFCSGFDHSAFALSTDGIDSKAQVIYKRLCTIGKWIIVGRGGIDIIGTMSSGDLGNMKKKIIGYVLGYACLLGLPWILDQAGGLFEDSPTLQPATPPKG